MKRTGLLVGLAILTVGCGSDVATTMTGEAVYRERLSGGNVFTCATCHALAEPASDGFRRPGHPIGNATRRETFKGGAVADLREAVNSCVVEWMNGDAFSADDARWLMLRDFLESQATTAVDSPVALQIVDPPADLSGGDVTEGRDLFNSSCAVCHGPNAIGAGLAPTLVGRGLMPAYIAERIRLSGSPSSPVYSGLTQGIMPFWGQDRLSDDELLDVVAFVNMVGMETAVPDSGVMADGGVNMDAAVGSDVLSGCDSTHSRVGQVAEFTTRFHDVAGTAHIIDDCTIEVRDFVFDATGVDVRLYGGLGGNYDDGVSMGDDLRRGTPYAGETIRFTLPSGATLDDLDGVSVWCVPVGISFGDGLFGAP